VRVYNEPCEMATDDEGRPRSFVWREREYTVIAVKEDWVTERPWGRGHVQLPDPLDYRVTHFRLTASSDRGMGVVGVRRQVSVLLRRVTRHRAQPVHQAGIAAEGQTRPARATAARPAA
jgi:hypothetical protein